MDRNDENLIAYEFLRDEIKREDLLVHQRLSASLAFQAILMAAMALVLSNGWLTTLAAKDAHEIAFLNNLKFFRMEVMFLIGAVGLVVGLGSVIGVHAALHSLRNIRTTWEKHIADGTITIDPRWPQAYGQVNDFRLGRAFPYMMSGSFVAVWLVYLGMLACQFLRLTIFI